MGDCHKYEKDSTPKRAFAGKSAQQHNPRNWNVPREHDNSYVQLSAKIAKLEKSNKKFKCVNKKRKRNCDSDSDDSNSSWSDGSGSPGNFWIICTKHDKTNTCVNTYPDLNKATQTVDSNINSILINKNIRVLWSNKDLKNLKNNNTLHKLEKKIL